MSEYEPSAQTVAIVGALVDAFPVLAPTFQEHLVDYDGEVLPHLFIADVMRWMVANVAQQPELVGAMLVWLEAQYSQGDSDVDNMIDVSFVEMLPSSDEPGAEIWTLLGPKLRAEAHRQGHWSDPA